MQVYIAQRYLPGGQWSASQWIDIVGEDGFADFDSASKAEVNARRAIENGECGIVGKVRILKLAKEISL